MKRFGSFLHFTKIFYKLFDVWVVPQTIIFDKDVILDNKIHVVYEKVMFNITCVVSLNDD